ncbi:Uncharacterised protein [Mycobacteroides abscessus subsp. abscessus]|nr:Uncharacterised protein [Mycobacteroides abscessus subsp. abscessus]
MSEIDFSNATQSPRVISELTMTTISTMAAVMRRRMSDVRRVSGCSRSPDTVISRPSTSIGCSCLPTFWHASGLPGA